MAKRYTGKMRLLPGENAGLAPPEGVRSGSVLVGHQPAAIHVDGLPCHEAGFV